MKYNDLNEAIATLEWNAYHLEETYAENEGEVTEETERMEDEIEALKRLLNTDGIDFLGRWLKGKEDRKKALKAEKDYIARQIEANDNTIEFIKAKISELMRATGTDKLKGQCGYSFTATTSTKTEVDKQMLLDLFQERVAEAVKEILPADVSFTLSASVSKVAEDTPLPAYYNRTESPSVRFTKPRAKKED